MYLLGVASALSHLTALVLAFVSVCRCQDHPEVSGEGFPGWDELHEIHLRQFLIDWFKDKDKERILNVVREVACHIKGILSVIIS